MTQLGNVLAPFDESDQPRGSDLRVTIEVPRAALGGSLRARVPRRLAVGAELVERAIDPEDPDHVTLHLPATLPAGAVLNLRGQGGIEPGAQPGDLYIGLEILDRQPWADERVEARRVGEGRHPTSPTLTWLVLLGFALVAATTVLILFG